LLQKLNKFKLKSKNNNHFLKALKNSHKFHKKGTLLKKSLSNQTMLLLRKLQIKVREDIMSAILKSMKSFMKLKIVIEKCNYLI